MAKRKASGEHKGEGGKSNDTKRNNKKRQRVEAVSSEKKTSDGFHVSDSEHELVVKLLRQVDWKSVVNTGRKNVIDPSKSPRDSRGKPYCRSFILGPNMKDAARKPSYWTEANPELFQALCGLMRKHDPSHKFTNITVNKNFTCKPHRDRGNNGKSYIIGFGEYQGGELCVGERDPFQKCSANEVPRRVEKLDIFRRFTAFYGCEQTHWVHDFKGERYTCVFYNFPELHEKGQMQQMRTNALGLNNSGSRDSRERKELQQTRKGKEHESSESFAKFASKLEQMKAKLQEGKKKNKRNK